MGNNIEFIRDQLHKLVDSNATFDEIYDVSKKLDAEVVLFYKKMQSKIKGYVSGKKYAV